MPPGAQVLQPPTMPHPSTRAGGRGAGNVCASRRRLTPAPRECVNALPSLVPNALPETFSAEGAGDISLGASTDKFAARECGHASGVCERATAPRSRVRAPLGTEGAERNDALGAAHFSTVAEGDNRLRPRCHTQLEHSSVPCSKSVGIVWRLGGGVRNGCGGGGGGNGAENGSGPRIAGWCGASACCGRNLKKPHVLVFSRERFRGGEMRVFGALAL